MLEIDYLKHLQRKDEARKAKMDDMKIAKEQYESDEARTFMCLEVGIGLSSVCQGFFVFVPNFRWTLKSHFPFRAALVSFSFKHRSMAINFLFQRLTIV